MVGVGRSVRRGGREVLGHGVWRFSSYPPPPPAANIQLGFGTAGAHVKRLWVQGFQGRGGRDR